MFSNMLPCESTRDVSAEVAIKFRVTGTLQQQTEKKTMYRQKLNVSFAFRTIIGKKFAERP